MSGSQRKIQTKEARKQLTRQRKRVKERESEKRKTALQRERERVRDSVNEIMGVKESIEFASGNFNNKML